MDILLPEEERTSAIAEGEKAWRVLFDAAARRHKEIIDKNLVGETVLYPNKEQVCYAALCRAQVRKVVECWRAMPVGGRPMAEVHAEFMQALKAAGEEGK